jgi:hypothetical protein
MTHITIEKEKLEQVLAEQFPDVVARVSPLELGPPVGWPLQYRILGPDKDEVRISISGIGTLSNVMA